MTGPVLLALTLLPAPASQDTVLPVADPAGQTAFYELTDEFLVFHLYFNPVWASLAGERDYDSRLPDLSRSALQARAEAYQTWLDRLHAIDPRALAGAARQEWTFVERAIRSELLWLVETRPWQRDPGLYLDVLASSVAVLVEDTGVPMRTRMGALTSRLRQLPTLLAEARTNLTSAGPLESEIAVESARLLATFFRNDAAAAFDSVSPGPAKTDFDRALVMGAGHVDAFETFLRTDLRPGLAADSRLGRNRLAWSLLYDAHVERSPRDVVAILSREIDQARGSLVAADDSEASGEVAEASSLASVDSAMVEARTHILRALVVTLPSDTRPRTSTRSRISHWDRSGVWGPGPLQPYDGPATLYLLDARGGTRPTAGDAGAPSLPYARAWIDALVMEEVFPGRFVASLYARRAPTRLRRVFRSPTLTKGWARYAAEAVAGDRFAPEVRPLQIRRRALALASLRAALLFHLGDLDLDEAVEQVRRAAAVPRNVAGAAFRRHVVRPFHSGILGTLQIEALREDYLAAEGEERTERRLHDAFLTSGLPPGLAREVLLPGTAGPALR